MIFLLRAVAVLAMALAATPAAAALMRLTVSGAFTGNLGGTDFADAVMTFDGLYDDADTIEVFGETQNPLTSLGFAINGARYTVDEPTMFFLNPDPDLMLAGLVDSIGSRGLLRFDPSLDNAFFTDALTTAFSTSGGALLLTDGREIAVAMASAVPEPTTWAMMIVGLLMVGGTLRSRRPAVLACPKAGLAG